MKKLLVLAVATLMLSAMGMTSGCTYPRSMTGMQQHPEKYYLLVPATEHEKRFPKGHVHRAKDPNLRCFGKPGTPNYFCQLFDEYDD